jgi:pimeloyl-ACP methyl ester carboxylesterase
VRVDLPGFGGSAPVADAIRTLRGRARVVVALADVLGIDRFTILGHSMGGGTALVVAAAHAARVRGLVLVASLALRLHRGLGASPRSFAWVAQALLVPGLRRLLLPWVRHGYRQRRFPGVDEKTAGDFAHLMHALSAADFEVMRAAVRRPLPPTLIAYARDDHMIETEVAEELAAAVPGARVLAFDDGGHILREQFLLALCRVVKQQGSLVIAERDCSHYSQNNKSWEDSS